MNINNIIATLNQVHGELQSVQSDHQKMVERNLEYFRIMATVKSDLEKTLKKPESLKETVYRCIDLLRSQTPYFSTNEGKNKIDPPLTEEQKTL
jgi:predicted secreted Zn-dependent protease